MNTLEIQLGKDIFESLGAETIGFLIKDYPEPQLFGLAIYEKVQIAMSFVPPKFLGDPKDYKYIYEFNSTIDWTLVGTFVKGYFLNYRKIGWN